MYIIKFNKYFTKQKRAAGWIVLSAVILLSLWTQGYTVPGAYPADINNPFHDVFYLYNGNERSRAVKALTQLLHDARYKTQALINYGLIHEYENDLSVAEKKYIEALDNKDRISVIYLYSLYRNNDSEKLRSFFFNNPDFQHSIWTLYEKAANFMEKGDVNNALSTLSKAVDNGFYSQDLLLNDPAFEPIRDKVKFRWLVHKAKNNKPGSILQKKKEEEYRYYKDMPYGINAELDSAAYFERTGREDKAVGLLAQMISEKISFRDRCIALFWLARINAKENRKEKAAKYLKEFFDLVSGQEKDNTGFRDIIAPLYKDIISNDRYLRNISVD